MAVFIGPDHVVEMANPAYLAFTGLTQEIVGHPARVGLKRGYARGFGALLDGVYSTGEPKVARNARVLINRTPDGPDEEAFADFLLAPLRDAGGTIYGVLCQGHEVTVQKLADDELRASREELRTALESAQAIFDNSHDVICVVGPDGRFRQVNKHAERLWGYGPEEMVGRSYVRFIHPEDVAKTTDAGRRATLGMSSRPFLNRYLHKDGTEVPMMWSAVRAEGGDAIISIGRDMREQMAAEEKLRQAQKMEAIGRLTGGIAHDFNNLLTVVIGANETLADALAAKPDLQAIANVGLDAAERGSDLVKQLLAFARNQPLAPQIIDCGQFVRDLLPILERTISHAIRIELKVRDEDIFCLADRTQLTSAILNLAINARDAMPDGGRLTLSVARDGVVAADGPTYVVFSVQDTGEGMSPQTRSRALEPFFTTKAEGKGSGLGLSMVDGFASQSGGRLEITSELGRGVQARVFLPRTERPEGPSGPQDQPTAARPGG
jgi:PAS domain S-box-containing protein